MVPYIGRRVHPVRKSSAFQWGSLLIKESHLLPHSKAVGLSNGVKDEYFKRYQTDYLP